MRVNNALLVAASVLAALLHAPAQATVVGWMGGHSPEPQLAGASDFVRWSEYGNYEVFSQISVSLRMPVNNADYFDHYGEPFAAYAPFHDMTFSSAMVGHSWTVTATPDNLVDFNGMVQKVSNGAEDLMIWTFGSHLVADSDQRGFAYGSIPMYGYYHFQGDLAGQEIEWMTLTLESYTQWWEPNPAAYCQYAQCHLINNVGFTYLLTFGNNDPAPTPTPEPGAAWIAGAGLLALAMTRRRRR